jgi:hypothetical protein
MATETLTELARLLHERNTIDEKISEIIHRPMAAGHAGEWIAAQVFDIQVESNAAMAAYDGRFRSGPLAGQTVNVKWYLKHESVLDMTNSDALNYYLVMTGPLVTAASIKERTRPWLIEFVYLFDARRLLDELRIGKVKIGIATSVRRKQWRAAEIYPNSSPSASLFLSGEQKALLRLFAPPA